MCVPQKMTIVVNETNAARKLQFYHMATSGSPAARRAFRRGFLTSLSCGGHGAFQEKNKLVIIWMIFCNDIICARADFCLIVLRMFDLFVLIHIYVCWYPTWFPIPCLTNLGTCFLSMNMPPSGDEWKSTCFAFCIVLIWGVREYLGYPVTGGDRLHAPGATGPCVVATGVMEGGFPNRQTIRRYCRWKNPGPPRMYKTYKCRDIYYIKWYRISSINSTWKYLNVEICI